MELSKDAIEDSESGGSDSDAWELVYSCLLTCLWSFLLSLAPIEKDGFKLNNDPLFFSKKSFIYSHDLSVLEQKKKYVIEKITDK